MCTYDIYITRIKNIFFVNFSISSSNNKYKQTNNTDKHWQLHSVGYEMKILLHNEKMTDNAHKILGAI